MSLELGGFDFIAGDFEQVEHDVFEFDTRILVSDSLPTFSEGIIIDDEEPDGLVARTDDLENGWYSNPIMGAFSPLGESWYWSDWLGAFYYAEGSWLYSWEFGWCYIRPTNAWANGFYLYIADLQSFGYTGETLYPYVFLFAQNRWAYYD